LKAESDVLAYMSFPPTHRPMVANCKNGISSYEMHRALWTIASGWR
jgi:hypothetical protein